MRRQSQIQDKGQENSGGEVLLDQLAQLFAVFVFHMHELNAIARGADVADDGRRMNLAQAGTNLELDGVARVEAIRRLNEGAAKADGLDTSHAHGLLPANMCPQRRFQRNSGIAARNHEVAQW